MLGISGLGIGTGYSYYQNTYNPAARGGQRNAAAQSVSQTVADAAVRHQGGVTVSIPAAQPEVPVQPAPSTPAADAAELDQGELLRRWENDPAAMAARARIQYMTGGEADPSKEAGLPDGVDQSEPSKSAQEIMEEGECQTCKNRKYQDGSDDPGVSFQTPTHIDPDQAASAVRGHEMEHVVRNEAAARREGRRVVSQSVTYHTAICPECGRVYISGGTTRTSTAAVQTEDDYSVMQGGEEEEDGSAAA